MTDETTDDTDELRARVEALEAENERKDERIDEQDEEIDRLSRDLAGERARATNLEETIDAQAERIDELEAGTAQTDESVPRDDSMLPMQRLIEAGEAGVLGHVTERVDRAKAIAENFGQWSKKTPNGLVIKDGLRDLLNAVTGERLAWSQVNRSCEALEEFTNGAIRFKRTRRHGNILIADPSDPALRSLLSSGG
jgi:chromosome segregation ATPase